VLSEGAQSMPPCQSKVELYAALRRDSQAGLSNRAVERKYGVGWRTVQQALSSAWPPPRQPYAPRCSKLDPFQSGDRRDSQFRPILLGRQLR
jgi:hypothetical protein